MREVKVAALSVNQTPLAWQHNKDNIVQGIKAARARKVQVLCCPELCITGYGCEDSFLAISTCEIALQMLAEIVPETKSMIVAVGLPLLYRDGLYNCAALLVDGKIAGFVAKQHLAGDGIHYEPRWFKPWTAGVVTTITVNDGTYPFGDVVFDLNDLRIGFEICEDAWAAERTGINLARRGVDLILNPSASHFALGKSKIRKRFVQEGARAFGVVYLYANLLGNEAGRIIYDGDTIIAGPDQLLASGPRFSFQDHILTTTVIDIKALRLQRVNVASYPNSAEYFDGIVEIAFTHYPKTNIERDAESPGQSWEHTAFLREEEFARAVSLGLFDYLRKSHSQGFVLNLSGGADSATCACLIWLMVRLGLQELDKGFFEKLNHIKFTHKDHSLEAVLSQLLYCLYQETQNNSERTKNAAVVLAKALTIPLSLLQIDKLVAEYTNLIEPILGRKLTWEKDDIALQNIQARSRIPSIWLLANVRNALLISTSNRSEIAVGYMTMDGDSSGGLSPLAGVDKGFIVKWLEWLEKIGPLDIGALPVLQVITEQSPTAELRPESQQQSDESDLMPYEWLDKIAHGFIHDKMAPLDILLDLHRNFSKISLTTLGNCVERFLILWTQNQWKRERLAPSFHLDDMNIDPRNWCRFPIFSDGFTLEISAMWQYIKKHDTNR